MQPRGEGFPDPVGVHGRDGDPEDRQGLAADRRLCPTERQAGASAPTRAPAPTTAGSAPATRRSAGIRARTTALRIPLDGQRPPPRADRSRRHVQVRGPGTDPLPDPRRVRPPGHADDPSEQLGWPMAGSPRGQLAVATYRGRKPIAFASVDDKTGKASLFTVPLTLQRAVTATFPLIPRRRVLGLPFGGAAQPAPRARLRRRRLAAVPAGRRRRQDRLVRVGAAVARARRARSSSCASTTPTRRRAWSCSATAARRCPSSPTAGRGSGSRRRSGTRSSSSVTAPTAARGLLGYLDEAEGEPFWRPPRSEAHVGRSSGDRPFNAPEDTLTRGLVHLAQHRRDLPAGTFVFVLSDFLVTPHADEWLRALERRWEIVPVVIQDPVWEQTLPGRERRGRAVPRRAHGQALAGGARPREVAERREENEERRDALLRTLRALDLEPVLVSLPRAARGLVGVPRLGRPADVHAGSRMRRLGLAGARRARRARGGLRRRRRPGLGRPEVPRARHHALVRPEGRLLGPAGHRQGERRRRQAQARPRPHPARAEALPVPPVHAAPCRAARLRRLRAAGVLRRAAVPLLRVPADADRLPGDHPVPRPEGHPPPGVARLLRRPEDEEAAAPRARVLAHARACLEPRPHRRPGHLPAARRGGSTSTSSRTSATGCRCRSSRRCSCCSPPRCWSSRSGCSSGGSAAVDRRRLRRPRRRRRSSGPCCSSSGRATASTGWSAGRRSRSSRSGSTRWTSRTSPGRRAGSPGRRRRRRPAAADELVNEVRNDG